MQGSDGARSGTAIAASQKKVKIPDIPHGGRSSIGRESSRIMNEAKRILVAEDDLGTRQAWSELITSWGYQVEVAEDGECALELVESYDPHILLLDLKLPRKSGTQVLESLRSRHSRPTTIVISGEGDIPDAVSTMKLGAYDYLRKPVDLPHLKVLLHNLSEQLSIGEENRRLRMRLAQTGELRPLIGHSPAMRRVMALVEQVAPSDAPVMIFGESGSGKEIVARTIHDLSSRHQGPYVAINCAALPETLMESELFGHERGAFTGADRRREGCFELAKGGTLLLDEITEMKVGLQAKLLRVLEEKKLRRVGGSTEIPLDVRVLAASNCDREAAIRENKVRLDLYYRLNVFTIEVPALRSRREDITALVAYFLREFSRPDDKALAGADNDCLEALKSYSWPGNVRELRNVVQRATVVARGALITTADLPAEITRRVSSPVDFELRVGTSLEEVERELIFKTLDSVDGNKTRAAEILGISLKTLYNRLDKYRTNEESRSA
jgi:DNA-binding NtrC family response regulator